jgi:putative ABC transport system ATP-binding protein
MGADTMLKAENVSKEVSSPEGPLTILANINLGIAAGESVAVVGPSGAGKSTLLALLAGLDEPSAGRIWLNGAELTQSDEDGRAALRAQHVGFVFQSFHLLPSLTALENVMLPLELIGTTAFAAAPNRHSRALDRVTAANPRPRRTPPAARPAALEVLDKVGLTARRNHYPRQLSGGEQQRVAIARAFVTRPAVLFVDEPTGNLDTATGEKISQLLFDLNAASGTTLVLVTHDQGLAGRCGRAIHLDAGRLV